VFLGNDERCFLITIGGSRRSSAWEIGLTCTDEMQCRAMGPLVHACHTSPRPPESAEFGAVLDFPDRLASAVTAQVVHRGSDPQTATGKGGDGYTRVGLV